MEFIFQVRGISQVISNTDLPYDSETTNNDWLIVKLDSPLLMGGDVHAACLPSPSYLPANSTEERCFTSGWGSLSSGMLVMKNASHIVLKATPHYWVVELWIYHPTFLFKGQLWIHFEKSTNSYSIFGFRKIQCVSLILLE